MRLDIPTATDTEDVAELEDFNLGTEIAKSLTLSSAKMAGFVGGAVAVTVAMNVGVRLYNRFVRKAPALYVVTDTPETEVS